jgi:pimeloyl-ACP methyl ester carboxylesterase
MGRGWKIALGVVVVVISLLAINTLLVDAKTESAEITVPGATILDLGGDEVQVVEGGPRGASPIVLIHCFTCAIDWWDEMRPALERDHRVIAIDLLGHGGSEKPGSGYDIENQAGVVAEALAALKVRQATVVGHSLGGAVAVGLAQAHPGAVGRVAIIDTPAVPEEGDLGFIAGLAFVPVIGEAGWRLKTDSVIRDGLEVAFAPGYAVPEEFVEDVRRMTYTAYDASASAFDDFTGSKSLADRYAPTGKPLLVIMGGREQIVEDPRAALDEYERVIPGAETHLLAAAGHSPNVEMPARTTALVLALAK